MRRHGLLITGSPGSGKTTVICKVAEGLSGGRVGGFYTEEIRVRGERRGFRLVTFGGADRVMAHVDIRGPHRVGKYGVNVSVVDELVQSALTGEEGADVYLVDEIGKMECLSEKFVTAMRGLLGSRNTVVAAIAQKGGGFIAEVKQRTDVELWRVTRANREELPQQVLAWLRGCS